MRRLFLLTLVMLLAIVPAAAQDGAAQILWPPDVYSLRGAVDIIGTVNTPDLNAYFLEVADYDTSESPDALWTPVTLPSRAPVTGGVIGRWDTTNTPDGIYTLRLRVVLGGGGTLLDTVGPLRVANLLADPSGEPVAVAQPTIEPTPEVVARPAVVNTLPVPVGGQFDNFDENAADLIAEAGLTWIKWQIPFVVGDDSLVTVARDRVNWSHERGFNVFLSVKGSKDEMAQIGAADYFPLYADFVGRLAALRPDAIQVWNEMNLDREWPRGRIDPRSYVELLRQSYDAIKAVDPAVLVVTGAPSPTGAEGAFGLDRVWNDDRYYLGMANAGAADVSDCIGIHYNEGIIAPIQLGGDPRGDYPTYYFQSMIRRAAFPFRATGARFCFSEMGYLSPEGYGQLPAGFAWGANTSVEEQAIWLRDAIQIAANMQDVDIALIIIFNVNFTRFVEGDPQGGYAIIRPDGSCPACETIATLRAG